MSQQVIELLSLIDTIHPGCPVSTDIHELLAYWNTGIKKKACSSMYLAPGKVSGLFETFSIGYSEGFNHSSLLQLLDKIQEECLALCIVLRDVFRMRPKRATPLIGWATVIG